MGNKVKREWETQKNLQICIMRKISTSGTLRKGCEELQLRLEHQRDSHQETRGKRGINRKGW